MSTVKLVESWMLGISDFDFQFLPERRRLSLRDGAYVDANPIENWPEILVALCHEGGDYIDIQHDSFLGIVDHYRERNGMQKRPEGGWRPNPNDVPRLRAVFEYVLELNGLSAPKSTNWAIENKKNRGYKINGTSTKSMLHPAFVDAPSKGHEKEVYDAYRKNVAIAEAHTSELLDQLREVFPKVLSDFFRRAEGGALLPFHVLGGKAGLNLDFPLRVTDEEVASPIPDRGGDSLVLQFKHEEKCTSNGALYRLHAFENGQLTLGTTQTINVLESCVYLRERMLQGWGQFFGMESRFDRIKAQKEWLQSSAIVGEWLRLVSKVMEGDFSAYHAGLAFSVPIFVGTGGRLRVACAEAVDTKSTGAGKLDVFPSSNLEFYRHAKDRSLSFEEFQIYIAKEFVEETMADPFTVSQEQQNALQGEWVNLKEIDDSDDIKRLKTLGDQFGSERLKQIIQRILTKRWEEGCGQHPLFHYIRTPLDLLEPVLIIDALTLRPEIVMPICLRDDPDDVMSQLNTNWEFKGKTAELMDVSSVRDLIESYLAAQQSWSETGIAALVLGAERFIE